jgi:hypothetical protein
VAAFELVVDQTPTFAPVSVSEPPAAPDRDRSEGKGVKLEGESAVTSEDVEPELPPYAMHNSSSVYIPPAAPRVESDHRGPSQTLAIKMTHLELALADLPPVLTHNSIDSGEGLIAQPPTPQAFPPPPPPPQPPPRLGRGATSGASGASGLYSSGMRGPRSEEDVHAIVVLLPIPCEDPLVAHRRVVLLERTSQAPSADPNRPPVSDRGHVHRFAWADVRANGGLGIVAGVLPRLGGRVHAVLKLEDKHGADLGQGVLCLHDVMRETHPDGGEKHRHQVAVKLSVGGVFTGALSMAVTVKEVVTGPR